MKKTIFILNVNDYSPEITALTYPLIEAYAHKIGADFHIIRERKFPEWPVTYEKLQIYELAQQMGNDFAPVRWRSDRFFERDGRHISSCNWLTVASNLCVDLWRPLDDLTPEEAIANITPITNERLSGLIDAAHLIDDYVLSRNIAMFGLKFKTFLKIFMDAGLREGGGFFHHLYLSSERQKIIEIKRILRGWSRFWNPCPATPEINNQESQTSTFIKSLIP